MGVSRERLSLTSSPTGAAAKLGDTAAENPDVRLTKLAIPAEPYGDGLAKLNGR